MSYVSQKDLRNTTDDAIATSSDRFSSGFSSSATWSFGFCADLYCCGLFLDIMLAQVFAQATGTVNNSDLRIDAFTCIYHNPLVVLVTRAFPVRSQDGWCVQCRCRHVRQVASWVRSFLASQS